MHFQLQVWFAKGCINFCFRITEISTISTLLHDILFLTLNKVQVFFRQRIVLTQCQCCVTFFWWIDPQLLLRFRLLHKEMILPRHVIFSIFVSISTSRSINYMIYFSLSIFLISINHTISLKRWYRLFGQTLSVRVLLSFCLTFWKFQPGAAYENVT